jgi:peptide/nickel transport system substrate-binding protein
MKKMYFLWLFLLSILIFSCKEEKEESNFSVVIGLSADPQALLPIKRNSDIERQVNQYIFVQATDYDPFTLKNIPILFEKLPEEILVKEGLYKNSYRYDLKFRGNAKWENGSPITAYDYLFTVKMILFPGVEVHPALRLLYSNICNIEIDKNDDKKFSVYTTSDYMLSDELATNMEIFPEYFYDSLKSMRNIPFKSLLDPNKQNKLDTLNTAAFVTKLNSAFFMREHVSGAGPYKLESWSPNNYIKLQKKQNWWGNDLKTVPYLNNNPDEIAFKIIADKNSALTELKSGNIDVLSGELGNDFIKMKTDPLYKDKFNFYNPLSTQYYSLLINNRNPILKEKSVRKAISRLIDVDLLIKTFGTGGERKTVSPIHPAKEYFNKSLKEIDFSVEEAKKLLVESGWKDSDGNGILDKVINGKKSDLKLSITITGKPFGKSLAMQLKQNAEKTGMHIDIVNRPNKSFKKALDDQDFDLAPIIGSHDLADIDPYSEWHSDNIQKGSSNVSGFANDDCDKIIDLIRTTRDKNKRNALYLDFQKILFEEQPVIFIFIPTNNIIVSKKFTSEASVKRPGYFANTFKLTNN